MGLFGHSDSKKVLAELAAEIDLFQKKTFTPKEASIRRDATIMGKRTYLLQLITGYLAFLKRMYQKSDRELPALVTADRRGVAPLLSEQTLAAEQNHWALEQGKINTTRDVPELTHRADEILQRIKGDLGAFNDRLTKYKATLYAERYAA